MGRVRLFLGHPGPPRIAKNAHFGILWPIYEKLAVIFFPCYTYVTCLLCDEVLLPWNFHSPGFDIRAPWQDPPNMKKSIFFSYFGFKLKIFISNCFLVWHVHRYGWEDSWKQDRPSLIIEDPPQGPLNSPKYNILAHIWTNWFSVWHVHRYGWEDSWKQDRPSLIIEDPPQGPLNSPKYNILAHIWTNWFSNCFPLLYICLHCDEGCISWHFGAPGTPGFM